MLRAAILFFAMGLFIFLLGLWGWSGVSIEIARVLLLVFLVLSLLSFIAGLIFEKRTS